jgi:hypothetical protein
LRSYRYPIKNTETLPKNDSGSSLVLEALRASRDLDLNVSMGLGSGSDRVILIEYAI